MIIFRPLGGQTRARFSGWVAMAVLGCSASQRTQEYLIAVKASRNMLPWVGGLVCAKACLLACSRAPSNSKCSAGPHILTHR